MKGDFSRFTFDPNKDYRQVLLQQGRVLVDADFNEQGAIAANGLRQLTRDLFGPHAGPPDELGFAIGVTADGFTIARGHYYVDGLLAVNAPPGAPGDPVPYQNQAAFPFPGSVDAIDPTKRYLFYLDVWERPVTRFEDGSIVEVALGGPDTSVRTQVVSQVRAVDPPAGAAFTSNDAEDWLTKNVRRFPRSSKDAPLYLPLMRAFVDAKDNPDDTPCVADPLGGYTGVENQLYRVEIHDAPIDLTKPATFKWSRDNAAVVAAWVDDDGDDLVVEGVRDEAHGFSAGQWVEITDEHGELRGQPGVMVYLTKVEKGRLTYDPASASGTIPARQKLVNPIVRRWDHGRGQELTPSGGAIPLQEGKDVLLERGIKVAFPRPSGAGAAVRQRYVPGDYWVFPARTATADIEWPFELNAGTKMYQEREPDGVQHVFAPLALAQLKTKSVTPFQRTINQLWTPPV